MTFQGSKIRLSFVVSALAFLIFFVSRIRERAHDESLIKTSYDGFRKALLSNNNQLASRYVSKQIISINETRGLQFIFGDITNSGFSVMPKARLEFESSGAAILYPMGDSKTGDVVGFEFTNETGDWLLTGKRVYVVD